LTDRKQLQPLELRPITSLPVGVCPKRPSEGIDRFFFSLEAENVLPVATGQKSGATASTLLPFRCPKTSQLMTTAIKTDCASLAKAWTVTMKIVCLYCGNTHKFQVRDAYTDAVVSNERMRGFV
jgi:hypothetical protein